MYETPPKIVAAEASWIETESISKLFQLSPDWLQPVSSGQATNWSSDPLFKGAYSFLPTGSMRNGWDVVNERHGRPWQCVLYLCCVLMVTIILYWTVFVHVICILKSCSSCSTFRSAESTHLAGSSSVVKLYIHVGLVTCKEIGCSCPNWTSVELETKCLQWSFGGVEKVTSMSWHARSNRIWRRLRECNPAFFWGPSQSQTCLAVLGHLRWLSS